MIVATLDDGAVEIVYPAPDFLRAATSGGGLVAAGCVAAEIEKWERAGLATSVATRLVQALAYGGFTTARALEIIRDKDVTGRAPELIHNTPFDRYFRNAWRRKSSGGPIWIDMGEARRMQARYIINARAMTLKKFEVDAMLGHNYAAMRYGMAKDFDPISYGSKLNAARTPEELRALWPDELRSDPKA